jgi:ubiquinone/menaquinone biosynthesis C-methylase UbiE
MKKSGNLSKGQNSILTEYAGLSHQYDSRWSFYIEATHGGTLARLRITRPRITQPSIKVDERLLDVGCGTGILLQRLSAAFPALRLAGVDPTSEMLAVARQRLKPEIRLEQAWAEMLPFHNETFDIVVSCNIFHYIREPITALRETARVLKPGGLFLMTDWCHDFLSCKICDLYLRLFDRAHFKTYRQQECYDMLTSTGFSGVEIERYKINWFWGLMTATAYKGTA